MAKAYVEVDGTDWTIDEYEKFMYGTGEWVTEEDIRNDAFFVHGSGCVIRKTTYETDFGDGARL
jgi:hypothetical protein